MPRASLESRIFSGEMSFGISEGHGDWPDKRLLTEANAVPVPKKKPGLSNLIKPINSEVNMLLLIKIVQQRATQMLA